jgi:hypothetical protein
MEGSVVSVSGRDSTFPQSPTAIGTAVLVSCSNRILALTCGNLFAVTDSSGKTAHYFSEMQVNLSRLDGTVISIPAKIAYADQINDFVVLDLPTLNSDTSLLSSFSLKPVPPSHWISSREFHSGDSIVYVSRLPTSGNGFGSYREIQSGTIAYRIPNRPFFLVDGLLAKSWCGSAVFGIRKNGNTVEYNLLGMAREVERQTIQEMIEEAAGSTVATPRSTEYSRLDVVTSMDAIVPVLISRFGFTR